MNSCTTAQFIQQSYLNANVLLVSRLCVPLSYCVFVTDQCSTKLGNTTKIQKNYKWYQNNTFLDTCTPHVKMEPMMNAFVSM